MTHIEYHKFNIIKYDYQHFTRKNEESGRTGVRDFQWSAQGEKVAQFEYSHGNCVG